MELILWTVLLMGGLGLLAAGVLYIVAKRFHVQEDERIGRVEECLPGANCGACGYKGCHDFAIACVNATTMEGLNCPGTSNEGMTQIASIMGLAAGEKIIKKAIVACNGTCANSPRQRRYDGVSNCSVMAMVCEGESDCPYGCLGCGDCVLACPYSAINLNVETGLPTVDMEKCVGCGKCVNVCPRGVMGLAEIPSGKERIIWVGCRNRDKGAIAMKECNVSCIGCGKCKRACQYDAVTVWGALAVIDTSVCSRCGACMDVCPRQSIYSMNIS